MKTLIMLGLFSFSGLLSAETISSRIHSVEEGLVKFENGRVAFLEDANLDLSALSDGTVIAELDAQSNLIAARKVHSPTEKSILLDPIYIQGPPTSPFVPTIVPSMAEAVNIFNRSNPRFKRATECSDRAHVWAHDEFKKTGTKSEKVFVFFTASYINRVRFKWWFHVAPLYTVNVNGSTQKFVMDYLFMNGPATIKEWTDLMVFTKRSCKMTTRFSEYDVNPQTEECYMMIDSMHYRLPGELQTQELPANKYKVGTTPAELKGCYNRTF
ncbi:MAG TPA: protein-glutamine glutaminase family protein [Bacteriovoracaceae bacterium]|nr:protein-glutamine glutaminase family protein [Bacteriovoracaceae bacterium]